MPESYDPPLHPELATPLAELTDYLVARERARCDYISQVVMTDLPLLRDVFGTEALPPEEEARSLFLGVASSLETLEVRAVTGMNLSYSRGSEQDDRFKPLFQLDWAQRYPLGPGSTSDRYVLWPTQRGFTLINGLRAARGQLSAAEERQQQQEAQRQRLEELRRRLRGDS